jgi:hypothetical protein
MAFGVTQTQGLGQALPLVGCVSLSVWIDPLSLSFPLLLELVENIK